MQIDEINKRIDDVLKGNRRIEWLYISLTVILFILGIICFIVAIMSGKYFWCSPPVITSMLLKYPLKEIKEIRQKNIALATAPVLITQLPPAEASKEIQLLLQNLYKDKQ